MGKAPAKKTLVPTFVPDDDFTRVNGEHQIFVSVNGKNYLVKTDETVMVPPEIKEVLDNAKQAKKVAQVRSEAEAFKDPLLKV